MATIQRRKSVTVSVGGVRVGSDVPVVVQSMTNTDTADVPGTIKQVAALARSGSELVRVTVNNDAAAQAVAPIVEGLARQNVHVPIIGDFHYNGHLLLTKYPDCARALAKYRINPGNVGTKRRDDNFRTIIQVAIDAGKPVRIGVNWGSLDQQLLTEMMDTNAALAAPRRRSHRGSAGCPAGAPIAGNPELHAPGHRVPGLRSHNVDVLSRDGGANPDLPARSAARLAGPLSRFGGAPRCRHGVRRQRAGGVETRRYRHFLSAHRPGSPPRRILRPRTAT